MGLTHTPGTTMTTPDTYTDDATGVVYRVTQDDTATDPRDDWDADGHAALYRYGTPYRVTREDAPENVAAQAFARFLNETGADDDALRLTLRYLAAFHADAGWTVRTDTIRGYSQGDWAEVFTAVRNGYGDAASYVDEYRQWLFGDVYAVTGPDDETYGGLYADSAEAAVQQYIDLHPVEPVRAPIAQVEGTIVLSTGERVAFMLNGRGGGQSWGAASDVLGRTVDARDAMLRALLDADLLADE